MFITYRRYFEDLGWFFAHNDEMEQWAVKQSELKRLETILPEVTVPYSRFLVQQVKETNWHYAFVPANFEVKDLIKIFPIRQLKEWGVWNYQEYQI